MPMTNKARETRNTKCNQRKSTSQERCKMKNDAKSMKHTYIMNTAEKTTQQQKKIKIENSKESASRQRRNNVTEVLNNAGIGAKKRKVDQPPVKKTPAE